MNYMANINRFYDALLRKELSTGQIALWQALMQIANREMWPDWFTAPYGQLRTYTGGLSRTGVTEAIDALVRKGLLEVRGKGRGKEYHLIELVQNPVQTVDNGIEGCS